MTTPEERDCVCEVLPGKLFLTNWRGAEDKEQLKKLGVTHVAAVGSEFMDDDEVFHYWVSDMARPHACYDMGRTHALCDRIASHCRSSTRDHVPTCVRLLPSRRRSKTSETTTGSATRWPSPWWTVLASATRPSRAAAACWYTAPRACLAA
eukprot:1815476-Prymnesium_polylepis.1